MLIGNTRIGGIGSLSVKNTYDPDALAYLTAVEAADGQALENSVKVAVNTFVKGCKTDGIWTAIKASCILAGARTYLGALVPLVGTAPTNTGFGSGDYSRKLGFLGDGLSAKYINTNRSNSADPQNSKHMAIYLSTSQARDGTRYAMGTQAGTGGSFLQIGISTLSYRIHYSSAPSTSNTDPIIGLTGASRSASNVVNWRYNGTSYNDANISTTPTNVSVYALSRGSSSSITSRASFYSVGENIDLALLDTRITTLMTTLNALL